MRQSKIMSFLTGFALGAAAMYVFDPVQGRRRRAFAQAKGKAWQRDTVHYLSKHQRDLRNRAHGFRAKLERIRHREEQVDGAILSERVRAAIGRKLRNPHSVDVIPRGPGEVILAGSILSREECELIDCARRVRGVRKVINELDPQGEMDISEAL